jgi:hypothetical protein
MSQALSPSILDRLLEPIGNMMPPDFAKELIDYRASPDIQARVDELADKCNEGELTDAERGEYDDYLQAFHLIEILQLKARRALTNGAHV